MIRWCSYCQRFMGESAPWHDSSMTHGICKACSSKKANHNSQQISKIQPIVAAYRQMRQALNERRIDDCLKMVRKAQIELGIPPFDLFMGVVQPLLHEIGTLWSQKKITIAEEHQFTAFAEVLLSNLLNAESGDRVSDSAENIDVVLACANGNYHTIGPRALEFALRNAGFVTKLFVPGLPAQDIVAIVRRLRPTYLGISASVDGQIEEVKAIMAELENYSETSGITVFVGGAAVRSNPPVWKELKSSNLMIAPTEIEELIHSLKKSA
jgi:methanogenic corrinoid protein MtbC1